MDLLAHSQAGLKSEFQESQGHTQKLYPLTPPKKNPLGDPNQFSSQPYPSPTNALISLQGISQQEKSTFTNQLECLCYQQLHTEMYKC